VHHFIDGGKMKACSANVLSKAALLLLLAGSTSSALANVSAPQAMDGSFIGAVRGMDVLASLQAAPGKHDIRAIGSLTRTDGIRGNTFTTVNVAAHAPKPQFWTLLVTGLGLIWFALRAACAG
jgi:hypothetical protein